MNERLFLYFKTIKENINNYEPKKHNIGYMYWINKMCSEFEAEKQIKYYDYGKKENEFDVWLKNKVSLND